MILTEEEFTREDLRPMVNILEERDKRQADYIKKKIKDHTEVNNLAKQFIDDYGLVESCALATIMSKDNGKLAFVLDIGWQVGGRMGVASYLNALSEAAIKAGDIQSAVMMRVFAICSYEYVIEGARDEDVEEIVREMYDMTIEKPTPEQWDNAHALVVTNEAETEALWDISEEENDDDELD